MRGKLSAFFKICATFIIFIAFANLLNYGIGYLYFQIIKGIVETQPDLVITISQMISYFISITSTFFVGYLFVVFFGKERLRSLGAFFHKHWAKHFIKGLLFGGFTIGTIWVIIVLMGGYYITLNPFHPNMLVAIGILFVQMFLIAYYEETLTRGVMAFSGREGGRVFAGVIVALIFATLHVLSNGFHLLSFLTMFFMSIVFSQLTWRTNDLWVAIGYHTAWNFIISGIFSVPINGYAYPGLIQSSIDFETIFNGGFHGIEASLICMFVLAIQMVYFMKSGAKSARF